MLLDRNTSGRVRRCDIGLETKSLMSKSCCISTSIPVDPAILFPSVVYRTALSIPPSSSCKLKRKLLAVSERGRRVNWQVSFCEGSGTLTTGRPFWTWI